ncbi:MAG: haloacid dehalogenase, partial [Clostridiales bacterium]|nr:haloacid dehalogenase [Clostridiales bacterium]
AAAISAEVGSGKVKEPIFLRIFELLAVRPDECVFIDNLRENLVVPRALGVHTIYFDFEKRDAAGLKQALVAAGLNI